MSLFDDSEYPSDDGYTYDDDDTPSSYDGASSPSSSGPAQGLLPPREAVELIGHAAAEQTILSWLSSGRMPHTLILSGPKGVGKSTLAFRLARFLFNNPNGVAQDMFGDAPTSLFTPQITDAFTLVASGGHPDMRTITRPVDEKNGIQKDNILIDDVRPVPDFLRKTPSMGGWRIVIIDDADTLNNASQNALLKILEEPPEKSLLVLVTHNIGAFLPTIRSRARVLDIPALSDDDFKSVIQKYDNTLLSSDITVLADYAGNAPGRAIELLEQGGIDALRSTLALFQTLPSTNDSELSKTAETLSVKSSPDPLAGMLDVVTWQLTANAKSAANQNDKMALRHWLSTLDSLATHRAMCENGNLDRRHLAFGALRILQTALK